MIEIYSLEGDKIRCSGLESFNKKKISWIRCLDPSKEELQQLSIVTKIDSEELEELTIEEVQRVEQDKTLFVVYKATNSSKDGVVSPSLSIFIGNNFILTVEQERITTIDGISRSLLANKKKFLLKKSPVILLSHLLDKINDDFLKIIERISDASELLKSQADQFTKQSLERMYSMQATLIHFNQALFGNVTVLNTLRKSYFKQFTADDREEFSDIYYDALELVNTAKIQRGLITTLFNLQNAMNDHKLNQFMQRLTSIALIIMIPTLISGIYGMNFKHVPLAEHIYGFYFIILFMCGFVVIALLLFKKLDWI